MTESAQQLCKIEFPCLQYPVKIIGDNCAEFMETVLDILCQHCPDYQRGQEQQQLSRNGRFLSVRVRITAQDQAHLARLNEALRATGFVRMVL